jgi:hypothetical protein
MVDSLHEDAGGFKPNQQDKSNRAGKGEKTSRETRSRQGLYPDTVRKDFLSLVAAEQRLSPFSADYRRHSAEPFGPVSVRSGNLEICSRRITESRIIW